MTACLPSWGCQHSTDIPAPVPTQSLPDYDLLSVDSTAYPPKTMLDHLHAFHNVVYLLANEAQEAAGGHPELPDRRLALSVRRLL